MGRWHRYDTALSFHWASFEGNLLNLNPKPNPQSSASGRRMAAAILF